MTILKIWSFTAYNNVSIVLAISSDIYFWKVNIEVLSLSLHLIVKSHSCANSYWGSGKNPKHLKTILASFLQDTQRLSHCLKPDFFFFQFFWSG